VKELTGGDPKQYRRKTDLRAMGTAALHGCSGFASTHPLFGKPLIPFPHGAILPLLSVISVGLSIKIPSKVMRFRQDSLL
jgi:hypothetical protein